jgi:hypothetical protein
VPKADPKRHIDHGDYLDVEKVKPTETIAESERFVVGFLEGVKEPRWPAGRG